MADYQKVEITSTEPTGPIDPASEPQPGTAQGTKPSSSPPAQPVPPAPAGERPSWLPQKFKSAEDLAKAYSELEGKLGGKKADPAPAKDPLKIEKEAPAETPKGLDLSAYQQEFMEKGALSEESFKALEGLGLGRPVVDAYIAGIQALSERQAAKAFDVAGGQEQYQAVAEWAKENLSEGELEAYNRAVTSGKEADMMFALRGLVGRYRAEVGMEPDLMTGNARGAAPVGFRSQGEWKAALLDPRYDKDDAYRADVMERLKRSNF